jgi:hypothetical protein
MVYVLVWCNISYVKWIVTCETSIRTCGTDRRAGRPVWTAKCTGVSGSPDQALGFHGISAKNLTKKCIFGEENEISITAQKTEFRKIST